LHGIEQRHDEFLPRLRLARRSLRQIIIGHN
jgi:hypothetical protein